jgi:hypothetical protein
VSGGERERGSGEGDRERRALVREIQREREREREWWLRERQGRKLEKERGREIVRD